MLDKCANPACGARLHYLRDGRLFVRHRQCDASEPCGHCVEHFWLCGACTATLTLALEPGRGLVALPRPDSSFRLTDAA
jgi:hypothetical protein